MHDYDIQTTLQDLGRTFDEFKSTNDSRLQMLESKNKVDPLVEAKLRKIEDTMAKTENRLQKLQAMGTRPVSETRTQPEDGYQSAFMDYVRKGYEHGLEQKSLSSSSDSDGGFLVPRGTDLHLQQTLSVQSVLRRLSSVRQISTDALDVLADKRMADAGWVAETADRAETDLTELVKIRIPVHEMYAKPRATQKLLDDSSVNIEEWIAQKIASKFATMENKAFLLGDGVNKPKGILAYDSVDKANWAWGKLEHIKTGHEGTFADGQVVDILIDTFHSLKSEYLGNASWVMSRSAQSAIRKAKDPHSGQYLWQPALTEGSSASLLGFPVFTCDEMPTLEVGTASKSVLFGNFAEAYQIVDRQGTRILRDPYSSKPYVEFYTTRRLGGDVVNFEALKVVNFSA